MQCTAAARDQTLSRNMDRCADVMPRLKHETAPMQFRMRHTQTRAFDHLGTEAQQVKIKFARLPAYTGLAQASVLTFDSQQDLKQRLGFKRTAQGRHRIAIVRLWCSLRPGGQRRGAIEGRNGTDPDAGLPVQCSQR